MFSVQGGKLSTFKTILKKNQDARGHIQPLCLFLSVIAWCSMVMADTSDHI